MVKQKNSSTEQSRSVPHLRFPEFVDVWDTETLDNLTERIGDGLHGTPEYVNDSDIYFINGNNLIDGHIQINETTKKVSAETFEQNDKNLSDKTLLISINGTIGSVARYYNEKVMLGKSVGYFNFKDNTDFFYYLLNTNNVQNYFISELTGSTIKNLSLKTLRQTKVNFPTLPEQTKIASFLTAVDEKLQALKKKKSLLEQYKKGIMQQLFSQELRFKDDNGNDFPDWEEKKLGEVCNKQSSNISANKIEENFGDYIIYGASGVLKKVDFYEVEEDYISIVKDGAGVGRLLYCKGKSSVLGTLDIIKPFDLLNTYFLYCLLSNIDFTKYITGSTIPHIYFKDYRNEDLQLPCLEEQTKIANFMSAIDDKINAVQQQIEKTEVWKKGLLQKMFV